MKFHFAAQTKRRVGAALVAAFALTTMAAVPAIAGPVQPPKIEVKPFPKPFPVPPVKPIPVPLPPVKPLPPIKPPPIKPPLPLPLPLPPKPLPPPIKPPLPLPPKPLPPPAPPKPWPPKPLPWPPHHHPHPHHPPHHHHPKPWPCPPGLGGYPVPVPVPVYPTYPTYPVEPTPVPAPLPGGPVKPWPAPGEVSPDGGPYAPTESYKKIMEESTQMPEGTQKALAEAKDKFLEVLKEALGKEGITITQYEKDQVAIQQYEVVDNEGLGISGTVLVGDKVIPFRGLFGLVSVNRTAAEVQKP